MSGGGERSADDAILTLRGVALGYGRRRVLEGLDVAIPRHGYVGIVGPNGSGKTTLLKAILGIHAPLAGEIRWGGLLPRAARPAIGYVPQRDAIDPLFPFTALDVVLLPLAALRGAFAGPARRAEDRRRAERALERVGLADVAGRRYSSLSGGQRQRVLMARALVREPEVLVLDEPTNGMDLGSTSRILDLVSALRSERHLTVLLVSHDLTLVAQRAERVLLLHDDGHAYGPTSEVVAAEPLRALYGDGVSVIDVGARRIVVSSSAATRVS